MDLAGGDGVLEGGEGLFEVVFAGVDAGYEVGEAVSSEGSFENGGEFCVSIGNVLLFF